MEFKLREWNLNDLESLVKYANNEKIAHNLANRFPYPYAKADGIAFITAARGVQPVQIFAIEINGEAAGAIGIHPQQDIYCKNAEMGYWLAEPYWNKGIITNAIKEMVQYGFTHFPINRIFARPFGRNAASQRVLEKAGFTLEYKLEKVLYKNGVYEDEVCYGIRGPLSPGRGT
ncbi:MAG: GNAT family N-acetyltransferase [Flavisolibacter sp.]|nr:GNAT family N-acetyltransferase [Flavisolibacter sp.]